MKIFFFITVVFCSSFLNAQNDTSYAVSDSFRVAYDMFDYPQPLEITFEFDVKRYQRASVNDKYIPATITLHNIDTVNDLVKQVRVRPRGNNRKDVCMWPPIRLNIRKADIINKNLGQVKNIKLVTHCSNYYGDGKYILKEYLIYKLYELVTPYYFRTRLARITYIDTGRRNKQTVAWAFFIEPEAAMAERLQSIPIKNDSYGIFMTDTLITNTMAMFQYMVGNADFSVAGRHNVKLLRLLDIEKLNLIPVPYDFDYAGMVDAPYAVPGKSLGITSVKERYFLGPCREPDDYITLFNQFLEKKSEFYKTINEFEYLSSYDKKKITEYLNQFFDQRNIETFIKRSILSTCYQ